MARFYKSGGVISKHFYKDGGIRSKYFKKGGGVRNNKYTRRSTPVVKRAPRRVLNLNRKFW
jgi:hypothetical protein